MTQPMFEAHDVDDLEADLDHEDSQRPGTRRRVRELSEAMRVTTALWRQRAALGLTVDEVAQRSGLSAEEVESVDDNDVDLPLEALCRYAAAVGLQFDLEPLQ